MCTLRHFKGGLGNTLSHYHMKLTLAHKEQSYKSLHRGSLLGIFLPEVRAHNCQLLLPWFNEKNLNKMAANLSDVVFNEQRSI